MSDKKCNRCGLCCIDGPCDSAQHHMMLNGQNINGSGMCPYVIFIHNEDFDDSKDQDGFNAPYNASCVLYYFLYNALPIEDRKSVIKDFKMGAGCEFDSDSYAVKIDKDTGEKELLDIFNNNEHAYMAAIESRMERVLANIKIVGEDKLGRPMDMAEIKQAYQVAVDDVKARRKEKKENKDGE